MWRGRVVAVVMPAYGEARLIQRTLARVPSYVDRVVVVDDASVDATPERVRDFGDPRVQLIRHETNRGVGAAIVTGYQQALADGAELLVVMAADDQMDPEDLPQLLDAVTEGGADYAKGNRFAHPQRRRMPALRRLGSRVLSRATRLATRLEVDDTQCGYTVLSSAAARRVDLSGLWPRYGYPNDLLALLAEAGCRVLEVPVRPVYADEESGLRPYHVATILGVIGRRYLMTRLAGMRVPRPRE